MNVKSSSKKVVYTKKSRMEDSQQTNQVKKVGIQDKNNAHKSFTKVSIVALNRLARIQFKIVKSIKMVEKVRKSINKKKESTKKTKTDSILNEIVMK